MKRLMKRLMKLLVGLLVGLLVVGAGRAAPRRIVSLNLCTDQYLLALADRGQIAGLTDNADKPDMSAAAAQARGLPLLKPSAENLLAIAPDLVMGMPARGSSVMAPLGGRHYPTLDLPMANNFADIIHQIRTVARAVGHPQRGEALVARMEHDLAHLPQLRQQGQGRGQVAAYYQRRGFLTGDGTLVDDLMRRVGLINLATRLHRPALSSLSIEELVAAQPDVIIVESATDHITDQGTDMLHHPALAHIPRLHLPEAWTVCGGPAYTTAARSLVAQMQHIQHIQHIQRR